MSIPVSMPVLESKHRWWVLATVALAQLMVVLDATIVNIAMPSAQADLGFSDNDRQWVVTAYALAFGSLLLLGGRLSDMFGRRRMFLIGLVGFALASALGGASQSFEMLVGARALQGIFAAVLAPAALSVLTTTFTEPKERARAFGVFGAIAGMGGAIGLMLGGYLTENFNWRWNLYVNVLIAVDRVRRRHDAAVPHPQPHAQPPRPVGHPARLGRTVLPGLRLLAGRAEGLGFADRLGFAGRELRAPRRLHPASAHRRVPPAAACSSSRTATVAPRSSRSSSPASGMFGVFLFLTYYLQLTLGYTPMQTGTAFLPMVVFIIITAQIQNNFLVPRFGQKVVVPIGMAIGAFAMLTFTQLEAGSAYWHVLIGLICMGIGMGSIMPPAFQAATLGVPRSSAGAASAMVSTSQQVGGAIGTAVLNTIAATAAAAYVADNQPAGPDVIAAGAIHSFSVAYGWSAGHLPARRDPDRHAVPDPRRPRGPSRGRQAAAGCSGRIGGTRTAFSRTELAPKGSMSWHRPLRAAWAPFRPARAARRAARAPASTWRRRRRRPRARRPGAGPCSHRPQARGAT